MIVQGHFEIFRDARFFGSFPAICALPDGGFLVFFRQARDLRYNFSQSMDGPDQSGFDQVDHLDCRSQITLQRLDIRLRCQGEPCGLPVDPEAADQDANVLRLRDGRLLLSGFSWYPYEEAFAPSWEGPRRRKSLGGGMAFSPLGYRFWGGYTRWSDDDGRSWSAHGYLPALPERTDIIPGKRPFHGGAIRGQALELPDGTLLLASYYGHPSGSSAGFLYRSSDRAETWRYDGLIALDPDNKVGYVEPALLLTTAGDIVAFFRTEKADDHLATVRSCDGGQTWSDPELWESIRGHPYHPLALADGRVLLTYGYRHEPYGIRARILDPEARQILEPEILLRDDSPSADVGYPWAAQQPGGPVVVVYYFCDSLGVRHIAGSSLSL